jgi:hypothetical protein
MPCYVSNQLPDCTVWDKNSGFCRGAAAIALLGCRTAMVSSLLLTSRITPICEVQAAQEESVTLHPQRG